MYAGRQNCCLYRIIPYTQNEAALAVVMGHEVSHAIFQHGNQRMSEEMGAEVVGVGFQVAVANKPAETQNLFLAAFGPGHRLECCFLFHGNMNWKPIIGVDLGCMAGYNPEEAIPLWERMEKAGGGQKTT